MRLGFIGCGKASLEYHLPACHEERAIQVVGAADTTLARREIFRSAAGLSPRDCVAAYADLLRRTDVDAVIIATPPAQRPPIALAALEAGKHTLCEKPMALAPAHAWNIARAARRANLRLGVVHNYYFRPDYASVKRVLESGAIGRPYLVTINFLGVQDRPGSAVYQPGWRHRLQISGGGVLMDMLHAVYLAGWFLSQQPRSVSAAIDRRLNSADSVEDVALCRFEFEHGFALVNVAWGEGPGGIEVMGSDGRLLLFYRGFGTGSFAPPEQLHVFRHGERIPVEFAVTPTLGVREVLRDFAASVAEERDPIAPGEEGCQTLEAVVGAYKSALLGRKVFLPLEESDPVYQRGAAGLFELEAAQGSPIVSRAPFEHPDGVPEI